MHRNIRKLMTRLCCPNMKKSKNQRRLVIVVALIGFYFLGRHSSSLSMANSHESERRFLRGPFRYAPHQSPHQTSSKDDGSYIVERPSKQPLNRDTHQDLPVNAYISTHSKVLQKAPTNEVSRGQHSPSENELALSNNVAGQQSPPPSHSNDQIHEHNIIKTVENQQAKTDKKLVDGGHDGSEAKAQLASETPQTQPTSHAIVASSMEVASTAKTDRPKPTVITAKLESTTKATVLPKSISSKGSTIPTSKTTTTSTAKQVMASNTRGVNNVRVGELVKDKDLFGFVDSDSNGNNLQLLNILKTSAYSALLQHQITKKNKLLATALPKDYTKNTIFVYGYNIAASDKLPLLRSLPDNRDMRCRDEQYSPNTLDISVISVARSETVSVVLRMVVSVLHRTPAPILREVILVKDAAHWSNDESDLFDLFVSKLPSVKLISHNESMGLAHCMNLAAKMATGQVLAFVSPKVEVTNDWHVSLLAWLADNPDDTVLPLIEPINWNTMEYSKSTTPVQVRGGFTWGLAFRWKQIPDEEKQRRQNLPIELRTPIQNGAIILLRKVRYNALLGANEALSGHDVAGTATELSIKHWMCGGMVLTIPCSRAGFLYALENPVLSPQLVKNRQLIAESLMDNYKKHFYNTRFITDQGDLLKRDRRVQAIKAMREKLKCNSFNWYMKDVYYDKKEPLADSQYAGLIRGTDLCVDGSSYNIGKPAACRVCSQMSTTQHFEMDMSGMLIFDEDLILGQRKPASGSVVEVLKKRTMYVNQEWKYDPKTTHLVHTASGLCMNCSRGKLTLAKCSNKKSDTQGWIFDWKR